jgi:hypothetical protein
MPLFNNNTSKRRRLPGGAGLTIVLAKMQLVSCQDIVTLDAQITGTAQGHHTYKWTQISGSPVLWLEPQNQLSTTFQQPALKDDKVFRFTLDKNTPWEQHADILVTLISLDPLPVVTGRGFSARLGTDAQLIQPPFTIEPGLTTPSQGVVVNNPSLMVTFGSPLDMLYNVGTLPIKLDDGHTPIPGSVLPPGVNYLPGLTAGDIYEFDSLTNNHGFKSKLPGPKVTVLAPANNATVMEYLDIGLATKGLNVTKVTTMFSIETANQDQPDVLSFPITTLGVTATKAVITRSLEQVSATSDSLSLPIINQGMTHTKVVTQSSHSSIGSGS